MDQNPASIGDVEARWRSLTDGEISAASALLDAAWAMLQTQAPQVADADYGSVGETLAIYILVTAVLRVMKNPDGFSSETIDDYTYRRDDTTSTGGLYFTDAEIATVGGLRVPRSVSRSMDSWAC